VAVIVRFEFRPFTIRMKKASKCRGQRISHTELVAESQQRLKECGVSNHQRAYFIRLVAEAVAGNPNPLFAQQQPKKPKSVQTTAWVQAYAIALQYLKELDLRLTLEAVLIERPDVPGTNVSGISNELIRLLSRSGSNASFGDRVQHIGSQPPPSKPKQSRPAKVAPKSGRGKGKVDVEWSDPDE
jgi:hypothetical protein